MAKTASESARSVLLYIWGLAEFPLSLRTGWFVHSQGTGWSRQRQGSRFFLTTETFLCKTWMSSRSVPSNKDCQVSLPRPGSREEEKSGNHHKCLSEKYINLALAVFLVCLPLRDQSDLYFPNQPVRTYNRAPIWHTSWDQPYHKVMVLILSIACFSWVLWLSHTHISRHWTNTNTNHQSNLCLSERRLIWNRVMTILWRVSQECHTTYLRKMKRRYSYRVS